MKDNINITYSEKKNSKNVILHGISFEDIAPVFKDPHLCLWNSNNTDRGNTIYTALGQISLYVNRSIFLVVAFLIHNENTLEILTARKANEKERKFYTIYNNQRKCTND